MVYNHLCFDEDHTEIYIEMVMIIFMIKVDNEDEKDQQSLRGGGLECGVFFYLSLSGKCTSEIVMMIV